MAAEVADGVLLNWCTPERVGAARAAIQEGAAAAGRDPADVTVAVYVRASLGASDEECMRALRTAAGEYASYPAYARQFALMGLEAEAERAAAAHAAGRPDDVPEHLVRSVALVGDPFAARERLDAYREAGADLPVVYPVATSRRPRRIRRPDVDRGDAGLIGDPRVRSACPSVGRRISYTHGDRVCKAYTVEKG